MSQASEAPTERWVGARQTGDWGSAAGPGAAGGGVADEEARLTRWMWVWITIGILVVLVVVGFLLGIVSALQSIDTALADATESVTGIESDANPLPANIDSINANLTAIDSALAPIPGQADDTIVALSSIDSSLQTVDGSLVDTSGSLTDTSGMLGGITSSLQDTSASLVGTSGTLDTVLGRVSSIRGTLQTAQRTAGSVPENMGTSAIHPRVAIANDILRPARADTAAITGQLVEVNAHLESICNAVPLPGAC